MTSLLWLLRGLGALLLTWDRCGMTAVSLVRWNTISRRQLGLGLWTRGRQLAWSLRSRGQTRGILLLELSLLSSQLLLISRGVVAKSGSWLLSVAIIGTIVIWKRRNTTQSSLTRMGGWLLMLGWVSVLLMWGSDWKLVLSSGLCVWYLSRNLRRLLSERLEWLWLLWEAETVILADKWSTNGWLLLRLLLLLEHALGSKRRLHRSLHLSESLWLWWQAGCLPWCGSWKLNGSLLLLLLLRNSCLLLLNRLLRLRRLALCWLSWWKHRDRLRLWRELGWLSDSLWLLSLLLGLISTITQSQAAELDGGTVNCMLSRHDNWLNLLQHSAGESWSAWGALSINLSSLASWGTDGSSSSYRRNDTASCGSWNGGVAGSTGLRTLWLLRSDILNLLQVLLCEWRWLGLLDDWLLLLDLWLSNWFWLRLGLWGWLWLWFWDCLNFWLGFRDHLWL